MADTAIAITAGTGTNVDTRTEATNGNHRQVIVLGDPSTNAGVAPVDATTGLVVNIGPGVALNSGTTSATTQRVVLASDSVNANGQAAMAASSPVVLANNQSLINVTLDTASLGNGPTGTVLVPKFAVISASTSGAANSIVAFVSSKKIRVIAWDIKVNAAVNFKWQSNQSTDLTGLYYNSAQGDGVARSYNPAGYFQTVAGEPLTLNLSGAVAVGGCLTYVEV